MAKYENIVYTRYLYIYQEVCLSLITDVLKGANLVSFDKVIYWISELYYSGYKKDIWCILFSIYYDFYHLNHPHLYKYLCKKYTLYIKHSEQCDDDICISLILSTYRNLFIKNTKDFNNNICIIVNTVKHTEELVCDIDMKYLNYKGRKPVLLQQFIRDKGNDIKPLAVVVSGVSPKIYKLLNTLFQAIIKKDIERIYKILYLLFGEMTSLYKNKSIICEIVPYIIDFKTCYYSNLSIYKETSCDLSSHIYNLDHNVLFRFISSIIYELLNKNQKNKDKLKKAFIICNKRDIETFKNTDIIETEYHWKIMREKVKYKISDEIALFDLVRDYFEEEAFIENIYYHWEYYAYIAPIWKKRFRKYKHKINDNKRTIIFDDEDDHECFCSKYLLEFDEQTREIQNKILLIEPIDDKNPIYKLLFDEHHKKDKDNKIYETILENQRYNYFY